MWMGDLATQIWPQQVCSRWMGGPSGLVPWEGSPIRACSMRMGNSAAALIPRHWPVRSQALAPQPFRVRVRLGRSESEFGRVVPSSSQPCGEPAWPRFRVKQWFGGIFSCNHKASDAHHRTQKFHPQAHNAHLHRH